MSGLVAVEKRLNSHVIARLILQFITLITETVFEFIE
jgi:hypothetical protein